MKELGVSFPEEEEKPMRKETGEKSELQNRGKKEERREKKRKVSKVAIKEEQEYLGEKTRFTSVFSSGGNRLHERNNRSKVKKKIDMKSQ